MKKAWKEIERLHNLGATHKKKGQQLDEMEMVDILKHAASEVVEFMDAPDDITEAADAITCLFHACVKKGWKMSDVEKAMLGKLGKRVTTKPQ